MSQNKSNYWAATVLLEIISKFAEKNCSFSNAGFFSFIGRTFLLSYSVTFLYVLL